MCQFYSFRQLQLFTRENYEMVAYYNNLAKK